jgi:hypothetical protein
MFAIRIHRDNNRCVCCDQLVRSTIPSCFESLPGRESVLSISYQRLGVALSDKGGALFYPVFKNVLNTEE